MTHQDRENHQNLQPENILKDKNSLEELRNSSDLWRAVFDAVDDAICLLDDQWNVLDCNKSFSRFLDRSLEHILGSNCCELICGSQEKLKDCPAVRVTKTLQREVSVIPVGSKWIKVAVDPLIGENQSLIGMVHTISDVTERKQVEENIKESEEYLKTIMDSIHAGIIIIEPETREVVDTNLYASEIIGLPKEQIKGRKCHEFICSHEVGICPITDLNKSTNLSERMLVKSNGEQVPILKNVDLVTRDGRKYLVETFFDITERKKVEEELKKSEQKYRITFEQTGTAMVIIEEDTTLTLVNEEFEKLSGFSKEEIEGKMSWTDFVHPQDLNRMKNYHNSRRAGGDAPKKYDFRFIDKGGTVRDILIAIDIIPGTKRSVGSLLDITYMRRVNDLLQVLSEINELVAREKNPEVVLQTVCEKLHMLYDAVFTSLHKKKGLIPVRSEGIELSKLKRVIERCPSISKAMNGEVMKMKMDDELCKHCNSEPHNYVLSLPLIHDRNHGVITIHSNSEFSEDELALLKKLSSNIAFALSAYEVEKDRETAIEQLTENLMQFDRSADRLRNPLAVASGAIELREEYGNEQVFRIVNEQIKKIKKELDKLRKEEIKTYELTEKAQSKGSK